MIRLVNKHFFQWDNNLSEKEEVLELKLEGEVSHGKSEAKIISDKRIIQSTYCIAT